MKALVTGADGLLGSNLVRLLLERQIQVRAFILPQSKSNTLEGLDIEKIQGDITQDIQALKKAAKGCDCAFHLAAVTNQWAPAEVTWKVNYDGTKNMIEAWMEQAAGRLIFTGSASSYAFGTIKNPGDETGSFPQQYKGIPYMESKHKAANLVREYAKEKGLDAVIVAPTFMLGDYDFGPSSGELIRQYLKRGGKVATPGGRNFAHAKDVAEAMANALQKGRTGESYILGGENLTYLDFFRKVTNAVGMDPPKIVIPAPLVLFGGALGSLFGRLSGKTPMVNLTIARLSLMGTYYSPEKAVKELEMPQTPVDSAIRDSIKSLKQYGHI